MLLRWWLSLIHKWHVHVCVCMTIVPLTEDYLAQKLTTYLCTPVLKVLWNKEYLFKNLHLLPSNQILLFYILFIYLFLLFWCYHILIILPTCFFFSFLTRVWSKNNTNRLKLKNHIILKTTERSLANIFSVCCHWNTTYNLDVV